MKSSKSVIQKRQDKIMNHLAHYQSAEVVTLARWLKISEITVRRDLDQMARKGLVERFFGGVRLVSQGLEPSTAEPVSSDLDLVKDEIVRAAAQLIEDKDVVFINSSSTAMRIVPYLKDKSVVIVTNNAKLIHLPHDRKVEVILTGGEVYGNKQSLIGEFALNTLSKIKATKCVIGVSGISVKGGITTEVLPETAINQMMLNRCNGSKIVVTDGSKIGRERNFLSGSLSDITHLITDDSADPAELERFRAKGLTISLVPSRPAP
ncbi:MAG: DeoR/GlpR family DNA-binding transcription regulator [Eubacteriales bacterium]|nr:DeoR/GlpR family DNA-binding transcription regulator [Eubacteriales bacterium]